MQTDKMFLNNNERKDKAWFSSFFGGMFAGSQHPFSDFNYDSVSQTILQGKD